jgi:hypothetical protein
MSKRVMKHKVVPKMLYLRYMAQMGLKVCSSVQDILLLYNDTTEGRELLMSIAKYCKGDSL